MMTYELVQEYVCIYFSVCVAIVCKVRLGSSVMFCGLGCVLYSSAVQCGGGHAFRKNMHARREGKPRPLIHAPHLQVFTLFALLPPPSQSCAREKKEELS